MKGLSSCLILATPMLVLPLVSPSALGQQVGGSSSERAGELQEIVVTAQRREENVLAVPASIQAFSVEELQQSGVQTLTDLQFTTPGYLPSSNSGYTQIYIRGIGNAIFVGADPSVATFVDDVPRIYGSFNENFVNVQRVEVLKGAQGGLYGRNATGGVVNIVTVQPSTDKFDGNALLGYGEMNTFRAALFVNVPVSDNVAFAISGERESHDAYLPNTASATPYTAAMFPTGNAAFGLTPAESAGLLNSKVQPPNGLDNQDFWATDDKLLLKFSDAFKITLAGDYAAKTDTDGSGSINTTPAYTQGFLSNDLLTPFGFNPQLPAGFEQGYVGKYKTSIGDPNFVDTWDYGGSITMLWNAPGVDLTSITAYRGESTSFLSGATAGTVPDVSFVVINHKNFVYQEFRAVSTTEGRFHWLGGATFLQNDFKGHTVSYLLGGLAPAAEIESTDVVHNWSVYAQADYDLTAKLNLTASGRYVRETNHAEFTLPTLSQSSTLEDKFLPSVTISYKVPDGNIYARWAQGFKAGGINPVAAPIYFPPGIEGSVFGPETVNTYEVGYRQGLLEHKVDLTTAIFYNDYKDVQFSAHANPAYAATIILAIVNGGSARTYGAEESLNWRVINPLTVGVTAGYLNARYKDFSLTNSPVLADFNLDGQTMTNSPTWQLSFSGNLDQPITGAYHLVGNVLVTHVGDVIFQYSNIPGVLPNAVAPGYWLTNARLGIRTSDNKYEVSLYANNLFNAAYYTFGNSGPTGNQLTWGNPRVIGGEITARF